MIKHWTFEDSNIANNFENHIRGQLPWYDLVTGLIHCIAENYLPKNGIMYDIGASTGNVTVSLQDLLMSRSIQSISIEPSKEMCDVWRGFGQLINKKAEDHVFLPYDLSICFLTLMFVDPSKRLDFFNLLLSKRKRGGALVVVDKFELCAGYNSTVMKRMTLRQKLSSGISEKEIIDKELSLSGVQRPLDDAFMNGEQFFQIGEFRGFIFSA